MSPAVMDITETAYNNTFQSPWVGTLEADRAWRWIDNFLLLVGTENRNALSQPDSRFEGGEACSMSPAHFTVGFFYIQL